MRRLSPPQTRRRDWWATSGGSLGSSGLAGLYSVAVTPFATLGCPIYLRPPRGEVARVVLVN